MLTGSEETVLKCLCEISIITHTFVVAFSSDVTSIEVNLESDAMLTGSEETLLKCLCEISIITHTFVVAFSSDVTSIAVNRCKNIIQHPHWGKIFPF